jgi:hypothetical protein
MLLQLLLAFLRSSMRAAQCGPVPVSKAALVVFIRDEAKIMDGKSDQRVRRRGKPYEDIQANDDYDQDGCKNGEEAFVTIVDENVCSDSYCF